MTLLFFRRVLSFIFWKNSLGKKSFDFLFLIIFFHPMVVNYLCSTDLTLTLSYEERRNTSLSLTKEQEVAKYERSKTLPYPKVASLSRERVPD